MPQPSTDGLVSDLDAFVRFRNEHLVGDERGEAQVFLDRLFRAFGHGGVHEAGATLEARVRRYDDHGQITFADLTWKPRVLIEMKKAGRDLRLDYRQAFEYWINLVPNRPRFVVLCNFDEFWVYDFDNQVEEPVDRVAIDDLPRRWEAMAFLLPEEQPPVFTNDLIGVTREAAAQVAGVFNRLIERRVNRSAAQQFTLQSVMAMFSEDIRLLPTHMFGQALADCLSGASAYDLLFGLFREMNAPGVTQGGRYEGTPYFNGGLFREVQPFNLEAEEVEELYTAARFDWSMVNPAVFGTLFEGSLDKDERHAFGAHFTSEKDIYKIVLPTIVKPWRERIEAASSVAELARVEQELLAFRVLDPACGCGNFLFIAYRELRRLERELQERTRTRRRGRGREDTFAFVSPRQFYGIDIKPFAVEIAKVTLELGRKLAADELDDEHVVLPLDDLEDNFIAGDALFTPWPAFDACIGNPPYLGRRLIAGERGADYASRLVEHYPEIGGVSDYVVYWFRKTHDLLPDGGFAGLVGTNTIRQGDSRLAGLDYITEHEGVIHDAVSTQPWSGDAQVSVSIVNWVKGGDVEPKSLWLTDGTTRVEVDAIGPSLSLSADLRSARNLTINKSPKVHFQGQTPGHTEGFVLSGREELDMRQADPGVREVIFPYLVGNEILHGFVPGRYVIDFDAPDAMTARAQAPLAYERLREVVLPDRQAAADAQERENASLLGRNPNATVRHHHRGFLEQWWKHAYRRADMLEAISRLTRYIALSRVSSELRHSVFTFVSSDVHPSDAVQVFALEDDYSLGILQSSVHRLWFEERCSTYETRLRYTSERIFQSFPWPQAPEELAVIRVAEATARLVAFRAERLTQGINLAHQYDSLRDPGRSELRDLHDALDQAVLGTYGFDTEEDVLSQILALNLSAARAEAEGLAVRGPGDLGMIGTRRSTYAMPATLR